MSLLDTLKDMFSGDNSKVDFTHVNSAFWIFAILGMWLYKSYNAGAGLLCDIPPGVQLVLFSLIGAAPASSLVNMGTAAYRAVRTPAQVTKTVTQTSVTEEDDGSARP